MCQISKHIVCWNTESALTDIGSKIQNMSRSRGRWLLRTDQFHSVLYTGRAQLVINAKVVLLFTANLTFGSCCPEMYGNISRDYLASRETEIGCSFSTTTKNRTRESLSLWLDREEIAKKKKATTKKTEKTANDNQLQNSAYTCLSGKCTSTTQ